jgi:hypothetical protein
MGGHHREGDSPEQVEYVEDAALVSLHGRNITFPSAAWRIQRNLRIPLAYINRATD